MNARIYKMSDEAWGNGKDWGDAFFDGDIETVEEFETLEDALVHFESQGYDSDRYGVSGVM